MSDHMHKNFKLKYPFKYVEAPVDYFDGTVHPLVFLREVDISYAYAFMDDFIEACQLCDCLRGTHDSALIVAPSCDADMPVVEAIVLKEDNNGTTITFSRHLLPWKSMNDLVEY